MNLDIYQVVKTDALDFIGTGYHMALFLVALCVLLFQKKEKDTKLLFGWYSLLVLFLVLCPVTAYIINLCIEGSFFRIFWLLPVTFLLAYAGTKIIGRFGALSAVLLAVLLAVSGKFLLTEENYKLPENLVKIEHEVVNVAGAISRDAKQREITTKKACVTRDLLSELRVYDSTILMPYGRNALKGENMGIREQQLYEELDKDSVDWLLVDELLREFDCRYLVYYVSEYSRSILQNMGYTFLCVCDGHYLYLVPEEKIVPEDHLMQADALSEGEYLITQFPGKTGQQSMFYMVEDAAGHLMVIDGGWYGDAEYVRREILRRGGVVDAWIVTHGHSDHAGAFVMIFDDPGEIEIKQVYMPALTFEDTRKRVLEWEDYGMLKRLEETAFDSEKTVFPAAGDSFDFYGLEVEFLSVWWPDILKYTPDQLNDGSFLFRIQAANQSMLFCGDVGVRLSEKLLEEYGDSLKADYVQMGHHGNGGLSEAFYRMVSPEVAFFDAPCWLFDNLDPTTGNPASYTTVENRELMESLGALVVSFSDGPNQVILR